MFYNLKNQVPCKLNHYKSTVIQCIFNDVMSKSHEQRLITKGPIANLILLFKPALSPVFSDKTFKSSVVLS